MALVTEQGYSIASAAQAVEISENNLRRWKKKLEQEEEARIFSRVKGLVYYEKLLRPTVAHQGRLFNLLCQQNSQIQMLFQSSLKMNRQL